MCKNIYLTKAEVKPHCSQKVEIIKIFRQSHDFFWQHLAYICILLLSHSSWEIMVWKVKGPAVAVMSKLLSRSCIMAKVHTFVRSHFIVHEALSSFNDVHSESCSIKLPFRSSTWSTAISELYHWVIVPDDTAGDNFRLKTALLHVLPESLIYLNLPAL